MSKTNANRKPIVVDRVVTCDRCVRLYLRSLLLVCPQCDLLLCVDCILAKHVSCYVCENGEPEPEDLCGIHNRRRK